MQSFARKGARIVPFQRMVCAAQSRLRFHSLTRATPHKRSHSMTIPARRGFIMMPHSLRPFSSEVVKVPPLGDSISSGTILQILKGEGEGVEVDDIVMQLETDKVNVDIRSPCSGVIKKMLKEEGEDVEVGADLFEVDTEAKAASAAKEAPPKEEVKQEAPAGAAPPKQAQAPKDTKPEAPKAPAAAPPKAPAASKPSKGPLLGQSQIVGSRAQTRVKMSRLRQTVAQRLKDSQNTAALLTTFQTCDMSELMKMRKQMGDEFAKTHGVKLGFMSMFVKASVQALKHLPTVNAYIHGNEIIYRDYIDISVAVAAPQGLLVPVIRNCDQLSFAQIEKTLIDLAQRGRDGKITLEDMAGGTFTISNGGVYGSLMGTPIINPPQSAILGMHGINNTPVVVGDKIEARPIMYLALTYDHRLIDGREAVLFLKKIKHCVEEPKRVLLDL